MSLLRLLFVGRTGDTDLAGAIERYVERTGRLVPTEVVWVKEEKPGERADPARILAAEARRILERLQPRDFLVLCDERGRELTSPQLAQELRRWLDASPRSVTFVVGGAFGLDPGLREKARAILPLSRLTLAHQLARLVLCEQVYRAVAALHGSAYSK